MNPDNVPAPRILLVDNYDSFTYNVANLFGCVGAAVTVLRNDDAALNAAAVAAHDGVCIGPGPGRPAGAGKSLAIIAAAVQAARPLLGICLGFQAIGEFFGGTVVHAPQLVHGKVSPIAHDGTGVFAGLHSPLRATRYHSLCVAAATFPSALRANATSDDGVVQGALHRSLPIHAVQFHPDSVLTPDGPALVANFLAVALAERPHEKAT